MHEKFTVDITNLVELLGKHLYRTPDVVLRELVQNAHDSIYERYGEAFDEKGDIRVTINRTASCLQIQDNGTGMDEPELRNFLSRIAAGLKRLHKRASAKGKFDPQQLIGEYGLGFFSAFIIADRIVVKTRKSDCAAVEWHSSGTDEYEIVPYAGAGEFEVGTRITLHLQRGALHYTDAAVCAELLRRHCDYLRCRIFLNEHSSPSNSRTFPWEATVVADQRRILLRHLGGTPEYFTAGAINARGVKAEYVLFCDAGLGAKQEIYSRRMFVTGSRLVLKEDLGFIGFILNSDSLKLTLGREDFLDDFVSAGVFEQLREAAYAWLSKLVSRHHAEPAFSKILAQQQAAFRRLCGKYRSAFDRLHVHLTFRLHDASEVTTVPAYVRTTKRRQVAFINVRPGTPNDNGQLHVVQARQAGIPLLEIESDDDYELLRRTCNKLGVEPVSLEKIGTLLLEVPRGHNADHMDYVRRSVERFLSIAAETRSFLPASLPMTFQEDRIILNENNAFLARLGAVQSTGDSLRPLYIALASTFRAVNRTNVSASGLDLLLQPIVASFEGWLRSLELWSTDGQQLARLKDPWWTGPASLLDLRRAGILRTANHNNEILRCFIACPFKEPYLSDFVPVAKRLCGAHHIAAEPALEFSTDAILAKICGMIHGCDFAIVDITEDNPNVLFEMGLLMARRKPVILTRNHVTANLTGGAVPVDIIAIERIEYDSLHKLEVNLGAAVQKVAALANGHA